MATRTGVAVAGVGVRAAGQPAPTWWAHHCAVAWAAAWVNVRGHDFVGARQLLADDRYAGEIRWRDRRGQNTATHRPDLVARHRGGEVAVEVELAKKSTERLRAILRCHANWAAVRGSAVMYVCADEELRECVRKIGTDVGLSIERGWLRLALLNTIKAQAYAGYEETRSARLFRASADPPPMLAVDAG